MTMMVQQPKLAFHGGFGGLATVAVGGYIFATKNALMTSENTLAAFPPGHFTILRCCACGHGDALHGNGLWSDVTLSEFKFRSRCSPCGSREVEIRIDYMAAGEYKTDKKSLTIFRIVRTTWRKSGVGSISGCSISPACR